MGEHGGAIKIKLRTLAAEGKANAALCSFLAEELKIAQRAIVLIRGHKSRDKLIRIEGLSEEEARRREHAPHALIGIFLATILLRTSERGGQPTGTTALATDFRIRDTASPRRKI